MTQLIFALDVESRDKGMSLARELKGEIDWIKVGLELFIACGPDIIPPLRELGYQVFLDLKLHDIPNTVSHAVKSAARLEIGMLTIHCQGGRRMCEAAAEAAHACAKPPKILGVTVLTSMGASDFCSRGVEPRDMVVQMANDAAQWGLDGVVCAAAEAGIVKKSTPRLMTICPGIRLSGAPADDQQRVMTPQEAAEAGADFIVVGRPIRSANRPAETARLIRQSLARAACHRNDF